MQTSSDTKSKQFASHLKQGKARIRERSPQTAVYLPLESLHHQSTADTCSERCVQLCPYIFGNKWIDKKWLPHWAVQLLNCGSSQGLILKKYCRTLLQPRSSQEQVFHSNSFIKKQRAKTLYSTKTTRKLMQLLLVINIPDKVFQSLSSPNLLFF